MNLTKEQAKKNLAVLVERFKLEFESGKTQTYNEEATKTAFIQPLLKDVLGWDVNNNDEVSPEERVSRDRVDYGLKINGKTVMFVEAKSVKADLNKHIEQAVMYGFNRRDVPFIMLTDFEGIMLFDTTIKPNFKNLKKGMKLDIPWKEYVSRFEELWVLSKESVLAGKLDELIKIKPKDRITIDKAILEDLEGWREKLAKDIYKNNHERFNSNDSDKDGTYLKEITQKILDRIIFMRFCEDRNLSNRPTLKSIFAERNEAVGTKAMSLLNEEFKHYNYIFNSDLFGVRDWDSKVIVDIKPLKEIILGTYDPYLFDVIPLEVLGNIYEQYLGYTIKLTEHQAKYELKPEVRKAGGVYYTPKYIVDYIVKNTVGKVLEESTPAKIKKLSILDPACGSGSFLIRAYEEMLNYYRGLKVKGDKILDGQTGFGIRGDGKERELTILEKAEILKRHIYGVDIDEQAVEVTKLSLMLKMLEGEQGLVAGRNVLPMLDKNIKCGNSLISGDSQELFKYFGKDYWKVKPFNWNEEFKQIMVDEGGFDVVVGNPPYIGFHSFKSEKEYFGESYISASGKYDIYTLFIEKGLKLIKNNGLLSYICPTGFMKRDHGEALRKYLLGESSIKQIIDFEHKRIFKDALNYTGIFIISKPYRKSNQIVYGYDLEGSGIEYKQESLTQDLWIFRDPKLDEIVDKIANNNYVVKLLDYCGNISEGIVTGLNDVYLLDNEIIAENSIETTYFKPCLRGRNIRRYSIEKMEQSVFYPYNASNKLIDENTFKSECPKYYKFLLENKNKLSSRGYFSNSSKKWYELWNQRKVLNFESLKIIVPELAAGNRFILDDKRLYYGDTVCGFYLKDGIEINIKYLLGLLNSKLIEWYYKKTTVPKAEGFYIFKSMFLKNIPIRKIKLDNFPEKAAHDKIVKLVEIMLDLNKNLQNSKSSEKDQIQRQIDQADKEIDELVYKLYGITEEEKKVIEVIPTKI